MSEVFQGALLVLMLLNGLVIGFIVGQRSAGKSRRIASDVPLTVEEQEKIKREREELKEEQAAFQRIIGYSADVAYGLHDNPLEGS